MTKEKMILIKKVRQKSNLPQQLYAYNVSSDDKKNLNSSNLGGDLRLNSKP